VTQSMLPTLADTRRSGILVISTFVSWPTIDTFEFLMSADAGNVGSDISQVGHGRKCGGSRWNRFAICFRSKAIQLPVSTSCFVDYL